MQLNHNPKVRNQDGSNIDPNGYYWLHEYHEKCGHSSAMCLEKWLQPPAGIITWVTIRWEETGSPGEHQLDESNQQGS
eukprot:10713649-Ditylum_brightwellii.AAC.1